MKTKEKNIREMKKVETTREKKITAKVYDLNSDEELNGDYRTSDHNNDNDNKEHTNRKKENQ